MTVGNFRVTRQECRQDLGGATLTVSAELVAPAGPSNQVGAISVEVAGVPQAAQTARAVNGVFSVTRRVSVSGASGDTVLRFVHNGALRSHPLTASHACISRTPMRPQPGTLTLPDLGFVGPIIIDYLAGDREGIFLTPDDGNPFTESRVYRLDGLTPWAVRADLDTAGRLPLYRLQAGCPAAGEAFMTMSVFVGVRLVRFAEIENYSPGISRYYDTRGTDGVGTWSITSGPLLGGRPFQVVWNGLGTIWSCPALAMVRLSCALIPKTASGKATKATTASA
jgi:hypothetical protein